MEPDQLQGNGDERLGTRLGLRRFLTIFDLEHSKQTAEKVAL